MNPVSAFALVYLAFGACTGLLGALTLGLLSFLHWRRNTILEPENRPDVVAAHSEARRHGHWALILMCVVAWPVVVVMWLREYRGR